MKKVLCADITFHGDHAEIMAGKNLAAGDISRDGLNCAAARLHWTSSSPDMYEDPLIWMDPRVGVPENEDRRNVRMRLMRIFSHADTIPVSRARCSQHIFGCTAGRRQSATNTDLLSI